MKTENTSPGVQDAIEYIRKRMAAKNPPPEPTVGNYFKIHPDHAALIHPLLRPGS